MKPRGCRSGVYIPWVCGKCAKKKNCKPRSVSYGVRIDRKARVRS